MKPLISVIIPVYNKENYIQKCLDSVLLQKYYNLEILLIDDGSNDSSGKILDKCAEKDERIKVFHIKNSGVFAARNFGLEKSTGKYVAFIDADDTVESTYIEKLFEVLEQNNCDIAQCNYSNVFKGEKKPVGQTGEVLLQSAEEAIEYIMQGKKYVVGLWPKLYKKDLFVNIPECNDIKVNEDYIVNFTAFQNSKRTVFIDLPLYNYYCNDDSVTHTMDNLKAYKDVNKVAKIIMNKSKGKSYENLAIYRYQTSFLAIYSSVLLSKSNVKKVEKKLSRDNLEAIYKNKNYFTTKDNIKAVLYLYLPFIYKHGYKIFTKFRKAKLDPEQ